MNGLNLPEEIVQKFWSFVIPNWENPIDGCWEWIGSNFVGKNKRARFTYRKDNNSIDISSARFLWQILHGKIKSTELICHKCNNQNCINIRHLYKGNDASNYKDRILNNTDNIGNRNGRSKVTEQEVLEIRKLSKKYNTKYLTEKFKLSKSQISKIINGKMWKHI